MQSNRIAFGVTDDGYEAVIANALFMFENTTTMIDGELCLDSAVFTGEIHHHTFGGGLSITVQNQRTCRTSRLHITFKNIHGVAGIAGL